MAGEDPFATHLLIQSADKLLFDLAKRDPAKQQVLDWTQRARPEYKDALIEVFRETYNFLKHADRDHDQTLHVGDIATSNVLQLGVCISNYQRLFSEWTDHMRVGFAIARFVFPHGFVTEDERPAFDYAVSRSSIYMVREFISDIQALITTGRFPNFGSERAEDLQDVSSFFERIAGELSFPNDSDDA